MKYQIEKLALFWVLAAGIQAGSLFADQQSKLETDKDKVSYGIGVDIARNFKRQGIDFDLDILIRGLKDGMSGDKILLPEKELRKVMKDYQSELRQKAVQTQRIASEVNKSKGAAFQAQNKAKQGVVTLPSGLQYKVLKQGEGKIPADTDTVEVIYRGTLIDGTEFDSSEGRPANFKVKGVGVIPGWTQALERMSVGSKWQLVVPSELAYGLRGVGRDIGPNETLIFEIELTSIK